MHHVTHVQVNEHDVSLSRTFHTQLFHTPPLARIKGRTSHLHEFVHVMHIYKSQPDAMCGQAVKI